jgi:hypothetical protein
LRMGWAHGQRHECNPNGPNNPSECFIHTSLRESFAA